MNKPLISVIVPVYKVEKYLERCVKSMCAQTYQNLEIVLVDDGSPDQCGEMCDMFAKQDSRIRVVHKENGGLSDARNAGLDVMTGDYVGFVDSDDWIEPDMYQVLYERLIKEKAEISCCGMKRCTDLGVHSYLNPNLEESFTLDQVDAIKELTRNSKITNSVCDKLYKKEIFSEIRMVKGILYEDFEVQPRCISKAQYVTYISRPMYCYYLSPDSILRGAYSIRQYDCITIARKNLAFYKENFPTCVPDMQANYVKVCMSVIYKSTGFSEWQVYREELVREMRLPISRAVWGALSKKERVKLRLLRINVRLFVTAVRMLSHAV